MTAGERTPQVSFPAVAAGLWLAAGWVTASMTVITVLESADRTATFVSRAGWLALVELVGGEVPLQAGPPAQATVPFGPIALAVAAALLAGWGGSVLLARGLTHHPLGRLSVVAARMTGRWACVAGGWILAWLIAVTGGFETTAVFLEAIVDLWCAVAVAGWTAGVIGLCRPVEEAAIAPAASQDSGITQESNRRGLWWVLGGIGLYTLVYTAMNWQMYHALLIPHGDSAMYEEHLWNVLHGKEFRSYLDQGLFLGEHIQIIHLALIPLYVFWPSHLLLELAESFALAVTALPVYWIARRHTQSERAAVWLSLAGLLYFPVHFLDIAIDFKTFRPMCLGVPLLMFAIDQMERGRLGTMAVLFAATLTAKEDFAIVIAPLGAWLFVSAWRSRSRSPAEGASTTDGSASASRTNSMIFGAATAVFVTAYLFLVVKVFIPWFRGGEVVHYARYFSRFGATPTEIAINMVTQPGLLLGELVTAGTIVYALRIVIPLGGVPLLSPTRLLVGAPLFVLLCLNELAQETPAPVHHFHAPLVPIVLWAAAAGLGEIAMHRRMAGSEAKRMAQSHAAGNRKPSASVLRWARFACLCALLTSAVVSFHPLSLKFWDAGRATYWQRLFVPGERARQFAKIETLIPTGARVASTDFVHPRYTHHHRSYDYSDYLRKVAGYEHRVPDDTDYIVIDTQHPYSTIKSPQDVRELQQQPDEWELLEDVWNQTEGYFIVLRRR